MNTATCACGRVAMEAQGAPIVSAICYCDDCQEGGRRIEALPGAARVLNEDGGSDYVVYRKDRVRVSRGTELLKATKVKEGSPTNRVIATCCNSAMMLNFDDSKHWLDFYRARLRTPAPPAQMLVCTRFAPAPDSLPRDVPAYPGHPFNFIAKLLRARIAMALGF